MEQTNKDRAIYVAQNGDDVSGTGDFGSPFRSPDVACRVARSGDTIFLRPGTYVALGLAAITGEE